MSDRIRRTSIAALALVVLGSIALVAVRRHFMRQEARDMIELALSQLTPRGEAWPLEERLKGYHPVLRSRAELLSYLCASAVDLDPGQLGAAHFVLGVSLLQQDCALARQHLEAAASAKLRDDRLPALLELARGNRCAEAVPKAAEKP